MICGAFGLVFLSHFLIRKAFDAAKPFSEAAMIIGSTPDGVVQKRIGEILDDRGFPAGERHFEEYPLNLQREKFILSIEDIWRIVLLCLSFMVGVTSIVWNLLKIVKELEDRSTGQRQLEARQRLKNLGYDFSLECLRKCIKQDRPRIIQLYMDSGMDGKELSSGLITAVEYERMEIVELLLNSLSRADVVGAVIKFTLDKTSSIRPGLCNPT